MLALHQGGQPHLCLTAGSSESSSQVAGCWEEQHANALIQRLSAPPILELFNRHRPLHTALVPAGCQAALIK